MGQSPFALARGQGFENNLFKKGAEQLRRVLIEAEILKEEEGGFRDLRLRQHGGESRDLDAAKVSTMELLRQAGTETSKRKTLPALVAGATIRIPGDPMLPEAILVIDVLILRHRSDRPSLMVGEIKTYPDRGGYTDAAELATARAQAGVYVYGIETALEECDMATRIDVAQSGFIVLTKPGGNIPKVRSGEDLRYQVQRAKRGMGRLREIAARLPRGSEDDGLALVRDAECDYTEGCISFCDRAQLCYKRAIDRGDPVVLGEEVARFLGPVTLDRAAAVLKGERAGNPAEEDLARRIADIHSLVRK